MVRITLSTGEGVLFKWAFGQPEILWKVVPYIKQILHVCSIPIMVVELFAKTIKITVKHSNCCN